jgi:cytidylate kinase
MIVTIDGPAAAGKGTLAARLSEKYRLACFDTGMLYRAIGLEAMLSNADPANEAVMEPVARSMTFPKMMELSNHKLFRSSENGQYASKASAHPKVRAALLQVQRDFALAPVFHDGTPAEGAVYDGRDTGTVVCPHADVKFFLTATLEERAQRRFRELQGRGLDTSCETVLNNIRERDERDSSRASAPLKPAEDAHILETTCLSPGEVFEQACEIIDSVIAGSVAKKQSNQNK